MIANKLRKDTSPASDGAPAEPIDAGGLTDIRLHDSALNALAILTSALRGDRKVRGWEFEQAKDLLAAYWERALIDHGKAMEKRAA